MEVARLEKIALGLAKATRVSDRKGDQDGPLALPRLRAMLAVPGIKVNWFSQRAEEARFHARCEAHAADTRTLLDPQSRFHRR